VAADVTQSIDCVIMAAVVWPRPPGVPDAMTNIPWEASWFSKERKAMPSAAQPPLPQTRIGNFKSAGMVLGK